MNGRPGAAGGSDRTKTLSGLSARVINELIDNRTHKQRNLCPFCSGCCYYYLGALGGTLATMKLKRFRALFFSIVSFGFVLPSSLCATSNDNDMEST